MSRLPKLKQNLHDFTLPSSGKEIQFRGYTTGEEKILLTAAESKNYSDSLNAIKVLVNNCVLQPDDFDVDVVPQFDLEALYLALKSKSSQSFVEFQYRAAECPLNNKTPCKDKIYVKIDLASVKVMQMNEDLETYKDYEAPKGSESQRAVQLKLNSEVGVKIRFPTLKDIKQLDVEEKTADEVKEQMILLCIEAMYDDEGIYERGKDFSYDDLKEFYDALLPSERHPLEMFVGRLPTIRSEVKVACSKCDFTDTLPFEGLKDFFE